MSLALADPRELSLVAMREDLAAAVRFLDVPAVAIWDYVDIGHARRIPAVAIRTHDGAT